jgi:hypothetical protein
MDLSGGKPRLFRANLLSTGVLSSHRIDARISFHTGPFRNSRCRLDDLADSNRMEIRNAFQSRPRVGQIGLALMAVMTKIGKCLVGFRAASCPGAGYQAVMSEPVMARSLQELPWECNKG